MGHHHHPHGHAHEAPANYNRAFAVGIALNALFVAIEATYGWLTGSLALLADAGHNLSDILGLALAWGAALLAGRRPTAKRTYGLRRATILASLGSALLLLLAVVGIVWEALERFQEAAPVSGKTVIVVAAIGVVINTATALMFLSGRDKDLNLKGAYLHMAADAAVSVGVVAAGVTIALTGWLWLDPAISLVIAAVILVGTWGLLRDSIDLAVDAVPREIDPAAVRAHLLALPGVEGLHDLHIWGLSTTEVALTVHLEMPDGSPGDAFLQDLAEDLNHHFSIAHPTVQIETEGDCSGCDEELLESA